MRESGSISEYRALLDKTLSSHDLTNLESLKTLVRNQIVSSLEIETEEDAAKLVERRTSEVSHFLGMLRSTSTNEVETAKLGETSNGGWKIKQDSEEFRVMYREGPEGTPFHTLLVEGFVDGPVDVCLCISSEARLYPKWWPQTVVPAFKITSSQCLKKIRAGEQICLVRMKVSWPLSAREALVHYIEFDYFKDGLVVVLLNSIPDLNCITKSTHGFTRDGIPDAEDVIRIDLVGGFAIQRVSANRSYFRTIANMDIKLDFIPPAFINFISRQLVGSGFKLYKKEVASVTKGDEDFGKVLIDHVYTRVREAIYPDSLPSGDPDLEVVSNNKSSSQIGEQPEEEDEVETAVNMVDRDNLTQNLETQDPLLQEKIRKHENGEITQEKQEEIVTKEMPFGEIEEIKEANHEDSEGLCGVSNVSCNYENAERLLSKTAAKCPNCEIEEINEEREEVSEDANISFSLLKNEIAARFCSETRKEIVIRPEVKEALRTLERAITIIREHGSDEKTTLLSSISTEEDTHNPCNDTTRESVFAQADEIGRKDGIRVSSASIKEGPEIITAYEARNSSGGTGSRRQGSSSYLRDANHSKIAPASPNEDATTLPLSHHHNDMYSSQNHGLELNASENITKQADTNDLDERKPPRRKRKSRYCCLGTFAI